MAEETFAPGRYAIPAPTPEENAAAAYQETAEAQERAAILKRAQERRAARQAGNAPQSTGDPQKTGENGAQGGSEAPTPAKEPSTSPEPKTDEARGFGDVALDVAADIGEGLVEAPRQVVGGIADAFDEAGQFLGELTGFGGIQITDPETGEFDLDLLSHDEITAQREAGATSLIDLIKTDEADSTTGGFVRATAQFLTGFLPALKGAKALGITGAVSSSMVAGAAADAVVFDPHEDRLSTFLNEVPALEPYVSDYLADNNPENESSWEGRLKNTIEGAGLGIATDGAAALFKAFKYYKAQRVEAAKFAPDSPSAHTAAAKDALAQAAREDIIQEIPDEALSGLGSPEGPLIVAAQGDETSSAAFARIKAADERVKLSALRADALGKIARITEARPPDALDELIDEVRKGTKPNDKAMGGKRPVAGIVKGLGGIDPSSSLAAELKARGISSKTHPGMFKKGGLQNLDNIPVSEQAIFAARQLDDGNGFVPEQSWIDALADEVAGEPWRSIEQQRFIDERVAPVQALEEELQRLGIDVSEMSNDNIQARLKEIADEEAALNREFAPRDESDIDPEAVEAPPKVDTLDDVTDRMKSDGLSVFASERNGKINLAKIIVPEDAREAGAGTAAMESLIKYADETGQTITLSPSSDFGGTKSRLVKFYKRFGFVENKGSNKDFEISESMYREADPAGLRAEPEAPSPASQPADLEDVLDMEPPDEVRPQAQPEGKVFINHARIQTSDDVKDVLQQMADLDADAIADKTRGVVTNEQTIKESSKEYQNLDDLIGRPPGPMSAAQAVAARKLLVSSGEQLVALAKKAQAPDASPADIYAFRRGMSVHYAIQSEVIAARTETARALQSWAIPAEAGRSRAQAINELITHNGGSGDLQAIAKAVANAGDNPAAVNAMARETVRAKAGKALYQVWINGLLSSPKTHVVNILSNAMVAAYAIPERYMAAGISKAFYSGEIDVGEVAAQSYGMVKGIRDGFRLLYHGNKAAGQDGLGDVFDHFAKTEIHGNDISAEAFGLDPAGHFGRGLDILGKTVNLPGSALEVGDKFFKSIGYRMELNALAFREASKEGLEGEAAARRVAEILANPPENLVADALDVAHYQTFTNELGKIGKSFQKFTRRAPGVRLVLPFIRTPTNIVKYTFARTPLAYMSGAIRADIKAGGARAAQAHARVALGSMLMLYMADMTAEGTVTGRGPEDPNMRRAKMNTGWMPYSVKVGDRWYQYSRTDPIGMIMGIGADITELTTNANDEDAEMMATAAVTALANNLANKTYMSGIYDFIGAIDSGNPTNDPGRYVSDFTSGLMPFSSFVRSVAGASDPIARETRGAVRTEEGETDAVATYLEGLIASVRAKIPGMGKDLPPRRDLFGEPINKASGIGWAYDFLSPVASRVDDPDPITQVILDNQISIPNPPRVIEGVRLSAEEYSEFSRIAGENTKEALQRLVDDPRFHSLSSGPDGMKAEMFKNMVQQARKAAKAQMMLDNPNLQSLSQQKRLNKMKTLQGVN